MTPVCIELLVESPKNLLLIFGFNKGKLPVKMKDGKLLPIEMTVKVRFDPNTQKLEVIT